MSIKEGKMPQLNYIVYTCSKETMNANVTE